jgi:chemotaxis protein methyltransferase CheR
MNAEPLKSFELRPSEFSALQKLVLENTGISLAQSKMELVKRRFSPRVRALGLDSYSDYIQYLQQNFEEESSHFCNAITTNLTSFYRENHHYEYLSQVVLPGLQKRPGVRKVRIWSAGCSTGHEAYCLAITVLKSMPDALQRDVKILATDLDENCIATGQNGAYAVRDFERVPPSIIQEYFHDDTVMVKSLRRDAYRANEKLKSLITFNKLNLLKNWPMRGKFDAIFCRNVFIYFDKPTQEKIIANFAKYQTSGSYLFLGHSETVANPPALGYQLIGKTTYQRI